MSGQLVSYIAPAAPATRRPAHGDEPFLRLEVGFTPAWYRRHLGIDFGERWHTDVAYRRETAIAMRAELRRRFPGAGIGGSDRPDAPLDLLTGVFGGSPVAAIFGLPVVYAADNWPNVEHSYLSHLEHYASIPNLRYIDMGLDSDLGRARKLMPRARRALMYTPMDLANKSEDRIRADFARIARDYAPCDIVIADIEAGTPDARVRLAFELCAELSAGLATCDQRLTSPTGQEVL